MVTPETRVMVEVLRLVGQKVLEFQEDQFRAWFGERWQRERDAKSIILCPGCNRSPGFERRGERDRCFGTRYGRVESTLL